MGCPICGRIYCDHSADERGQTVEEMMNDAFTPVNNTENGEKVEDKSEETKERKEDN
ncbi:MAG: hypothetical protein WC606_02510 [Candidatus Absconditabacterales bacterium]|jgi:hypothetical protein